MDREGLAEKIKVRRLHLGMSISGAGRDAGVHRLTWRGWEHGVLPEEFNFVRIEKVLQWLPGGVLRALAGQEPVLAEDAAEPEPTDINEEMLEFLHLVTEQLVSTPVEVISHEEADEFVSQLMRKWERAERDRGRYLRTLKRFREEDAQRHSLTTERKSHTPNE